MVPCHRCSHENSVRNKAGPRAGLTHCDSRTSDRRLKGRAWESLNEPFGTAYCRWRQAEALLAARSERARAAAPVTDARRTAVSLGAEPLQCDVEDLARRARIELDRADEMRAAAATAGSDLGLTQCEVEVLGQLAAGRKRRLDRRGTLHQQEDDQRPRVEHPAQAGRVQPHRRRGDRATRRPRLSPAWLLSQPRWAAREHSYLDRRVPNISGGYARGSPRRPQHECDRWALPCLRRARLLETMTPVKGESAWVGGFEIRGQMAPIDDFEAVLHQFAA